MPGQIAQNPNRNPRGQDRGLNTRDLDLSPQGTPKEQGRTPEKGLEPQTPLRTG